jgi:hypothetical protein
MQHGVYRDLSPSHLLIDVREVDVNVTDSAKAFKRCARARSRALLGGRIVNFMSVGDRADMFQSFGACLTLCVRSVTEV